MRFLSSIKKGREGARYEVEVLGLDLSSTPPTMVIVFMMIIVDHHAHGILLRRVLQQYL
jgi:hypothetical protein